MATGESDGHYPQNSCDTTLFCRSLRTRTRTSRSTPLRTRRRRLKGATCLRATLYREDSLARHTSPASVYIYTASDYKCTAAVAMSKGHENLLTVRVIVVPYFYCTLTHDCTHAPARVTCVIRTRIHIRVCVCRCS